MAPPGAAVLIAAAAAAGLAAGASDRPRPPVVVIALDASGSLSEAEIARSRALAVGLLERLPPGGEVAVFAFEDESRLVQPRTSSPDLVRRALAGIRRTGRYTALHDALYDASRYLDEAEEAPRAIVLFTDGRDENSSLTLEDGLRTAQGRRIPVFAVGMGRVEERVLRRIAKLTGGEYVAAGDVTAATLAPRLLARLSSPAAQPGGRPAARATAAAPSVRVASEPAARRTGADESAPPGRALLVLWWILAGLAVAAAIARALRRLRRPRCTSCGRSLPDALASCAFCAEGAGSAAGATAAADVSPTVVERLNITEEYLEKTVTLRERPVLTITRGPGTGELFELSHATAVSIGRARANDIVLKDASISGQHCRIRPEQGAFVLHDLRSTNGTFVNDRRVDRHRLAEGDLVQVGETVLEFRREHLR